MCAQYTIKASPKTLASHFQAVMDFQPEWELPIVPHAQAPVITENDENKSRGRTLQSMRFSLLPSWSREPKVKFSTYNARLVSTDDKTGKNVFIHEKPTWRDAFSRRHCLVPISEFIEPAYTGRMAGHMIRFFRQDQRVLGAAGIWEQWIDKKSGEIIDSFAIITDEPDPFVRDLGHDRMPLFLQEGAFSGWLQSTGKSPQEWIGYLQANRDSIEFDAESERPMKAGWEKRIP